MSEPTMPLTIPPGFASVVDCYTLAFQHRFWAKVALCSHGITCAVCCWPWQGAMTGNGYGTIWAPPAIRKAGKSYIGTHQAAWEMHHGTVPPGFWVLHDCPMGDNTLCVNYNGHLWLGTATDNNHDMIAKGRQRYPHGRECPHAKLSEADIRTICALRGQFPQHVLGHIFGIEQTTVSHIQRGESWKHVPRTAPVLLRQAEQVAKLTQARVYAIRRLQGHMTEARAAALSGVTRAQIGRIWRRECWAWLPEEEMH
jgi:hypothetical protein